MPRQFLREQTFRSLRHRDYRYYFFGQIISLTGSWMQSAALMWLVYDRTNDPIWPPLLIVAQIGPTLLFGTWGGTRADRYPKRQLIVRTQSAFLLIAVVLTLIVSCNLADPGLIFLIMMANGIVQAIDLPTRLAYVPSLVPREDLINTVSLNSLTFNSARAIGPAMAGCLFILAEWLVGLGYLTGSRPVILGAIWCFALNALSYLAVLAALGRISLPGMPAQHAKPISPWQGLVTIRSRHDLALLLVLTGCISVFAWPMLSLFPAYTRLVLELAEKEYSLLVSSLGAGALLGALTTASFGSIQRRGRLLFIGVVLVLCGLIGLALVQSLIVACICASIQGCGLILYLSTGQSTLQLSVKDDTRGRVMALWAMTLSASAPIGHLAVGFAASHWPIRHVILSMACGVALVLVGVIFYLNRFAGLGRFGSSTCDSETQVVYNCKEDNRTKGD